MSYLRYSPQPVLLPAESLLTRQFLKMHSHLSGNPLLTADDYKGYETHTVFNDVFIDADGKSVRAIGPPWVNLTQHVLPLQLSVLVEGRPLILKHRQVKHKRVLFHRFVLPKSLHKATELLITLQLNNGQRETLTVKRQKLSKVRLQFVTLQKNNPIEWILDWLRYCQRIGVQRVLLYDNGSDNAGQLDEVLRITSGLPDIVLIDWNFPYGPLRSYYNRFCQPTQNNHVYQCFDQADWTGHFDVDEYLVVRDNRTLYDLLDEAPKHHGLLRFDSCWVPDTQNVLNQCLDERLPTVRDFSYREIQSRGKAHKYIARNRRMNVANTHNAKVSFGCKRKAVDTDAAIFLHYKCLTNNWRGFGTRSTAEELDSGVHTEDTAVQRQMQVIDETRV